MMLQIHQHEGEVVEHIDTGDQVTELNAVEQRRASFEQTDVGQPHVAMTAAHTTAVPSQLECRRLLFKQHHLIAIQRQHGFGAKQLRIAAHLLVIALDRPADARTAAKLRSDFRAGVEARDLSAQRLNQSRRELAGEGYLFEQVRLREAPHDHHPIEHFTCAIECQSAVEPSGNRAYFQIDARRPCGR